jgi:hypothetical protein
MNQLRLFILLGLLKPRKQRPVLDTAHLIDGDGAFLVDENGNRLTG